MNIKKGLSALMTAVAINGVEWSKGRQLFAYAQTIESGRKKEHAHAYMGILRGPKMGKFWGHLSSNNTGIT